MTVNDIFLLMLGTAIFACVGIAGAMAYDNKSGWGWFLFIAVLILSGIKIK